LPASRLQNERLSARLRAVRTNGAPFEDVFFEAARSADLQKLLTSSIHDANGPSNLNVRRFLDHAHLSILTEISSVAELAESRLSTMRGPIVVGDLFDFTRDQFRYEPAENVYYCPEGKPLRYRGQHRTEREGRRSGVQCRPAWDSKTEILKQTDLRAYLLVG
jgi:hypothetical protein